jgi:hypothetical protein
MKGSNTTFLSFFEGHFCHPGSGSGSRGPIESRFNPDTSHVSISDQYLKEAPWALQKGLVLQPPISCLYTADYSPLNTMRPPAWCYCGHKYIHSCLWLAYGHWGAVTCPPAFTTFGFGPGAKMNRKVCGVCLLLQEWPGSPLRYGPDQTVNYALLKIIFS